MKKVRGLFVAETVFNLVEHKLDNQHYEVNTKDAVIAPFINGRENGLVFMDYYLNLAVWVFECRNSDEIVVALGAWTGVGMNNMYSDDVHEFGKKCFECDNFDKAADYIVEIVTDKFNSQCK